MSEKKNDAFFDKAVFGGYDTEQVDEFVEEARKLLSSLKKENEVLKQKLTILADKIEEYQAAEAAENQDGTANAAPVVSVSSQPQAEEPAAVPAEPGETAPVTVSADAVAEAEMRAAAIRQFEETLTELKTQIAAEHAVLESLMQEKTALAALISKQYAACLQAMQSTAPAQTSVPTAAEPSAAAAEAPVCEAVAEIAEEAAVLPGDSVAEAEMAEEATVQPEIAPTAEEIPAPVAIEPAPAPVVREPIAESAAAEPDAEPIVQSAQSSPQASAVEPETAAAPAPVAEPAAAEVPVSPEKPVTEPVASIAETVEAGESVYLNTDAADVASLSYEEALAMILKKNGILREPAPAKQLPAAETPSAEKKDDMQTTKIIPRIPSAAAQPVEQHTKRDKKKKESFFKNLRKNIHNFLEDESDDDDLDVFMPVARNAQEQDTELQFGKAYNVKNDK